jgi:hypothetical protein
MLTYDSDIISLIWSLNHDERSKFVKFFEDLKATNEDLSELCDEIIKETHDATKFEKYQSSKEDAASEGETTIPKEDWGVHETHCCSKHGCKYCDTDCPVVLGLTEQQYPCEWCKEDELYN